MTRDPIWGGPASCERCRSFFAAEGSQSVCGTSVECLLSVCGDCRAAAAGTASGEVSEVRTAYVRTEWNGRVRPAKLRSGRRGSAMRPGGVSVDNVSGMAAFRSERSLDRRCFSEWGGIAAGRCFSWRCFYRSGVSGETGMRLGGGSDGPFRLERRMRPGTFRPSVRMPEKEGLPEPR